MDRPAGRPVADQVVMVAVDDESVALRASGVMAMPGRRSTGRPGWSPVTVLVIVQVNVAGTRRIRRCRWR